MHIFVILWDWLQWSAEKLDFAPYLWRWAVNNGSATSGKVGSFLELLFLTFWLDAGSRHKIWHKTTGPVALLWWWCGMRYPLWLVHGFLKTKNTLFFRAVLGSQQNWGEDTEITPITLPHHMHNLPHHRGILVIIDEPTLTYHQPESVVYIRVCSWFCTFLWVLTNVKWHVSTILVSYRIFSPSSKSFVLCLFILLWSF